MPTDREAMEYLRQGTAQGIPPEQLKETLRKAGFAVGGEPYTPLAEPAPSGLPADVEAARAAGSDPAVHQQEKEGIGMAAGALLGGVGGEALATRFIPRAAAEAPRIIRMLSGAARLAPEISGEMAGTYGGGRIAGMPEEDAKFAAKMAGVGGIAGRTIARVGTKIAGRAANLPPETVNAGIDDPRLLRAPEPDAELAQANRLIAQIERQRAEITPTHAAYQGMLAEQGGKRIDGNAVLDAFQKNITGRDNKPSLAADREVRRMADKFIDRLGPDSKISLAELDDYIRQEFTKPLVGQYAKESEAVAAQRMMDVRHDLTALLYGEVGPGAAPAQGLAGKAIRTREAVENVFDLGPTSKPSGTAAERIRGILSDSGEAQKNRAVLAAYDEEYGTTHLKDAQRLAMQQQWQGKDLSRAVVIDSILQPTRPGFVQGIALPVARGGARIARVAGPIASSITAGTQAEKRKKKEKKR